MEHVQSENFKVRGEQFWDKCSPFMNTDIYDTKNTIPIFRKIKGKKFSQFIDQFEQFPCKKVILD